MFFHQSKLKLACMQNPIKEIRDTVIKFFDNFSANIIYTADRNFDFLG